MNGIPVLTLLTVLPLVGAAIALSRASMRGRVALVTTLASLALALMVWTQLPARWGYRIGGAARHGRRRWALSITWAWTGWAR